jgi:hypothetical protein
MSAQESAEDLADKALDAAEQVVPSNLSEAEAMASMLAINIAADHLLERAIGKKVIAKAAQQAVSSATKSAAKSVIRAAAKEAAVKAGAKLAAEATVQASAGPAGWVMLAVQVGGMLLDFFDPFNIARSYTNYDLKSMHDMMAAALTATLKNAKACIDPSYTTAQAATDTQPDVICTDDGLCVAMFPGTSKLTPPPTARCFDLPFPATAKPVMPAYDPRVPKVVVDLMSSPDAQGALLLHNWLVNQTNTDARVFSDPATDAFYREYFLQALIKRWQAAGQPPVPAADTVDPVNIDGVSIKDSAGAALAESAAAQNTQSAGANSSGSSTKLETKLAVISVLGLVAALAFLFNWRRSRRVPLPAPPVPAATARVSLPAPPPVQGVSALAPSG